MPLATLQTCQLPCFPGFAALLGSLAYSFSCSPSFVSIATASFAKQGGGVPLAALKHDPRCSSPFAGKRKARPAAQLATPTADAAIAAPAAARGPFSAHRNPSITPGHRIQPVQPPATAPALANSGYATGDASIQNCTTNGITRAHIPIQCIQCRRPQPHA